MQTREAKTDRTAERAGLGLGSRATQPRRYHFSKFGAYLGYLDEVGHYYDRGDAYRGSVSDSGTLYDEQGVYRGRIDVQGQYWDEHGVWQGYFWAPDSPVLRQSNEEPMTGSR